MYTPKWIRAIQENNRNRREAHAYYVENLKVIKPIVLGLDDWQKKSAAELKEMLTALRMSHMVLLVDKMGYLATLRPMGTLENIIYTPEVYRQQRDQDGALEALEQMIITTSEAATFLREYNEFKKTSGE